MFVTVMVYCVASIYPKYVAPRLLNLALLISIDLMISCVTYHQPTST